MTMGDDGPVLLHSKNLAEKSQLSRQPSECRESIQASNCSRVLAKPERKRGMLQRDNPTEPTAFPTARTLPLRSV